MAKRVEIIGDMEILRGREAFDVRVVPGAGVDKLEILPGGSVKVWVRAAPEDGKANAAVEELLAKALGVAKSRVAVVKGATARVKTVAVEV